MLRVQRKACATCVYRDDSPLNVQALEARVRDPHGGFSGYRVCHHSKDACCRGFWNRHKWEFQLGQIAQRLKLVEYVDDHVVTPVSKSMAKMFRGKE
jgi:hypothetical protein